MPIETPKEKFLRFYPRGFSDPLYLNHERNYKVAAHDLWCELLNEGEFDNLLIEKQWGEICHRVLRVEAKTNLLSRYEKSALHDAVKKEHSAKFAANVIFDLIYGEDDF